MGRFRGYVIAIAVLAAGALIFWLRESAEPQDDESTGSAPALVTAHPHAAIAIPWLAGHMWQVAGVVTLDGAPVAGASVRLVVRETHAEWRVLSDAAGRFDFGAKLAGKYAVIAEKTHYTGAVATIDARDPDVRADQVRLTMHACDASLHGTVHDVAGGVVGRAHVAWVDRELAAGPGVDAEDDGNYDLCVPVGWAGVAVTADGYAQLHDQLTAFGRVRHDFWLSPEVTLQGRVVRAGDHSPVAGAIVELRDADYASWDHPALYASADASGEFHIEGAAPGGHVITATADHLATASPVEVVAEVGRTAEPIVCEVFPAATISGTAVERGSRAPAGGVTVLAGQAGRRIETGPPAHAVTQPDGSFTIDHVRPGSYELRTLPLAPETKPAALVKVDAADITGLSIEVDRPASIAGRITRGGKPVDDARVNTEQESAGSYANTNTDHDGLYTLRGLLPGTYHIYAESDRIGAFTHGPAITVAAGEQKTGVDVELELAGSIAGSVVDQRGAPVGGVVVKFSLLHGSDFGTATTADDGSFLVRGLSGGGSYVYQVVASDAMPNPYRPVEGKRFAPIAVHDGDTHITGVIIKVRVDHLAIAGRVIDAGGKPVPDASVTLSSGVVAYGMSRTVTDLNGAFTFRDLPEGTYGVRAVTAHGEQIEPNVAAGRTNVVVRIAELGGIDGTLDGFDEAPEVLAMRYGGFSYQPLHARLTGNTFQLRDLSPGEYMVSAMSASSRISVQANVVSGAIAKVALHQRAPGAIAGSIVDEARAPAAGMMCGADQGTGYDGTAAMTRTDASGNYRFDRVAEGETLVSCWNPAKFAQGTVRVVAGQTARLDLVTRASPQRQHRHPGLELESQLGEAMVKSVEPGGPADRAGIVVGDIVVQIGSDKVEQDNSYDVIRLLDQWPEATVKLTLERDGKDLVVELTLDP